MPEWLVGLLLAVFAVHLGVFARLAMVREDGYYWLLSGLFAALTLSFALRLAFPELRVGGFHAYMLLRLLAWGLAAVTLPILAVRILRRFRG